MVERTPLRILYIGDAVGKAGRAAIKQLVPLLRNELRLDAVFLNAENIAHGRGITPSTIEDVEAAGVDFCSSGNHIYDNADGTEYLKRKDAKVLRPANYPNDSPGRGWASIEVGTKRLLLINLLGQVFVNKETSNPFHRIDEILKQHSLDDHDAVIIDIHAEATSEKQGLAWYVDGRVSAVVGTHTHVPTADLKILPKGTGIVADLGSVAAYESVLGFGIDRVIERFITEEKAHSLQPVESGRVDFCSVLIEIDPGTGKTVSMQRIDRSVQV